MKAPFATSHVVNSIPIHGPNPTTYTEANSNSIPILATDAIAHPVANQIQLEIAPHALFWMLLDLRPAILVVNGTKIVYHPPAGGGNKPGRHRVPERLHGHIGGSFEPHESNLLYNRDLRGT